MPAIPQKKPKPEEIVAKLRQVDMLLSQGRPVAEAMRLYERRSFRRTRVTRLSRAAVRLPP